VMIDLRLDSFLSIKSDSSETDLGESFSIL